MTQCIVILIGTFHSQYLCNYPNSNRDDLKHFHEIDNSLATIGFNQTERFHIYKILAAILHLGNVNFEESPMTKELDISDKTQHHFTHASQLLNVEPKVLKKILLMHEIEVNGMDLIT